MSRADIYRAAFKLEAKIIELKDYILRADIEYGKAQLEIKRLKEELAEAKREK